MKSIKTLVNEQNFRLRDDTKFYADIFTCPECGSKKHSDLGEYDCVNGKRKGDFYQYYMMQCDDCGARFYNVFRNLGALTGEQLDNIVQSGHTSFKQLAEKPE